VLLCVCSVRRASVPAFCGDLDFPNQMIWSEINECYCRFGRNQMIWKIKTFDFSKTLDVLHDVKLQCRRRAEWRDDGGRSGG
jgi:hypothetical protein